MRTSSSRNRLTAQAKAFAQLDGATLLRINFDSVGEPILVAAKSNDLYHIYVDGSHTRFVPSVRKANESENELYWQSV